MMDIGVIVKSQIELMRELSSLMDVEKEVLVKDKGFELEQIIEKKKEIAQKIAYYERERLNTYSSEKASELVAKGILKQEDIDEMKKLAALIKEKNETNMILTRQSINYIRMIRNVLNPQPKVVTYGNNGRVGENKYIGGFNRKI